MNIDFSMLITSDMKIDVAKKEIKNKIASKRYSVETGGIVVKGVSVNTERDSQNMINGAVVSCLIQPDYVCNWKTPEGFVELNASLIKQVGVAIRTHVQACFDREAELIAHVDADTYVDSMLNEGWPNEVPDNA